MLVGLASPLQAKAAVTLWEVREPVAGAPEFLAAAAMPVVVACEMRVLPHQSQLESAPAEDWVLAGRTGPSYLFL